MTDVTIRIVSDANGAIQAFNETGTVLQTLGQKADDASGQNGTGGLGGLAKGAADAVMGVQFLSKSLSDAGGLIYQQEELGKASIRAKEALGALSEGHADQYLNSMSHAAGGVIDNMQLAKEATLMLSTGVAKSQEDVDRLTHAGSVLGEVFKGEASAGIDTLTLAEEGQIRAAKQLGLSQDEIKDKEATYLARGIDQSEALRKATLDVAEAMATKMEGSISGTGDSLERLGVQFSNFKTTVAENVAKSIEEILKFGTTLSTIANDDSVGGAADRAAYHMAQVFDQLIGKETMSWDEFEAIEQKKQATAANDNARPQLVSSPPPLIVDSTTRTKMASPDRNNFLGLDDDQIAAQLAAHDAALQQAADQQTAFFATLSGGGAGWRDPHGVTQRNIAPSYQQAQGYAQMRTDVNTPIDQAAAAQAQMGQFAQGEGWAQMRETGAPFASSFSQALESAKPLATLVGQMATGLASAAQGSADTAAHMKEADNLKGGIATTFGVPGQATLYGEAASGVEGAVAQKRAELEKADAQKYGADSTKTKADLAAYDIKASEALDTYALSTGAATKGSLAFRDEQTLLQKQFLAGQLTVDQYTTSIKGLADAAAAGGHALEDFELNSRLGKSVTGDPKGHGVTEEEIVNQTMIDKGLKPGASGQASATDPFAAQRKSLETFAAQIATLPTTAITQLGLLASAAETQAKWADPVSSAADTVIAKLGALGTAMKGLVGTLNVQWVPGPSGGPGSTPNRNNYKPTHGPE